MSAISLNRLISLFLLLLVGVAAPLVIHAEPKETIINNGPSDNRVDIVVMGDGYTASQMDKYRADVQQVIQAFFAQDPYREYQSYFNVIRIDLVSNQSGADHPERGTFVDTALDSAYNCNQTQRLICVNVAKSLDVINRSVSPAQSDIRIVIVNDVEYGGSGGVLAVGSIHPLAVEILLHEVGHSFGFLGDEYGGVTCGGLTEPSQPNLTRSTTLASIKWNYWIDASTPIPTNSFQNGVPGLYEGAFYCDHGYYRPTFDSKMRSLDRPFEQINTEQLIKRMYDMVSPIEAINPDPFPINLQQGQTQIFSITKLSPLTHLLDVSWSVDGQTQGSADTFTLNSAGLVVGAHTVDVLVKDNTPAVRRDPLQVLVDTRRWTLTVEAVSTPTPTPTPTPNPIIITESNSNRAISLESVTFVRDPFPTSTLYNFSTDHRTRIMIFASNAQLLSGESLSLVTAQVELGTQVVPVEVEYVGPLTGVPGVSMVVIKLPETIAMLMDAQVRISVRGLPSNKALVAIRPP